MLQNKITSLFTKMNSSNFNSRQMSPHKFSEEKNFYSECDISMYNSSKNESFSKDSFLNENFMVRDPNMIHLSVDKYYETVKLLEIDLKEQTDSIKKRIMTRKKLKNLFRRHHTLISKTNSLMNIEVEMPDENNGFLEQIIKKKKSRHSFNRIEPITSKFKPIFEHSVSETVYLNQMEEEANPNTPKK